MAEAFKSGFVALIGRTNVGKSTLMNRLIGQKVAITCNKPQTTRTRIRTILTEERGQMIFVDTPGIHKAQNKLGEYMVGVAERTLSEVDVIIWLVEPESRIGTGDRHIAEILKDNKTPKILVINKTDTVKKEQIPALINMYRELADFDEIVPISALNGYNEKELKKVIFSLLPEGPMYYDEDELTDQPERQIVAEIIREKALEYLNDEVPHGIAVTVDLMKERPKAGPGISQAKPAPGDKWGSGRIKTLAEADASRSGLTEKAETAEAEAEEAEAEEAEAEAEEAEAEAEEAEEENLEEGGEAAIDEYMADGTGSGFFDIQATIICERESHKGIIIGRQGSMLKRIGTGARLEMEANLGIRVNLRLFVKVKKDWRDSESMLRNYGFRDDPDD